MINAFPSYNASLIDVFFPYVSHMFPICSFTPVDRFMSYAIDIPSIVPSTPYLFSIYHVYCIAIYLLIIYFLFTIAIAIYILFIFYSPYSYTTPVLSGVLVLRGPRRGARSGAALWRRLRLGTYAMLGRGSASREVRTYRMWVKQQTIPKSPPFL